MTLTQLREGMTYEELALWNAYFQMQHDLQDEAMKKASRGRR